MSGTTFRRGSIVAPKPMIGNQIREKERFELSTLNDKFADYVEKVRYLEAQNKKVQMESNYLQEKQDENCGKIKTLFESEIGQLKTLAENLFQNKNTAFTNSQDTQNSISVLKQRLTQTLKQSDSSKYEAESVERELSSVEGDVLMYKRRLAHQDSEHTQWKQFLAHIQRLLLQAKNEIHNETVARSSSEQTIKQIRLDIHRLRDQHQQKLQDLKKSSVLLTTNSTNERAHHFKSELSNAIRRIRQDFDKENDLHRNDLYGQFNRSYDEISRQYPELASSFLNEREQDRIRQEEDRLRVDIQRLRTDSQSMKQKNTELKVHIRELQINLEMSLEENQRIEQMQKNQLNQYRLKHEQTNKDYEDVISKQTTLEKEIETYRNLLEGTMKPVIDHITEEYGSFTAQQGKTDQSSHPKTATQSEFVLRSINDLTGPTSRRPLHAKSQFVDFKVPSLDLPKATDENRPEPTTTEDVKNEATSSSSPPTARPPIIIQTRRNN